MVGRVGLQPSQVLRVTGHERCIQYGGLTVRGSQSVLDLSVRGFVSCPGDGGSELLDILCPHVPDRWGSGIDDPREAGRGGVSVAGRVGSSDLEGVAAIQQSGVALGAGAHSEESRIEAALEGAGWVA